MARSRGADVRLIGLSWPQYALCVLALPSSRIETAADLRASPGCAASGGRDSIDVARATALRGFGAALNSAGLEIGDATLVDIDIDLVYLDNATASTSAQASLWDALQMPVYQREEAAALVRGEVDAIFASGGSGTSLAAYLGAKTVINVGQLPNVGDRANNTLPLAFSASGTLIDERPDLVARWLAVALAAADWATANPVETHRVIAAETGVAEEIVPLAHSSLLYTQLDVTLAPELLAALRSQHDFLLANGFLAGAVDFTTFVDAAPLRAAGELLAERREELVLSAF